MVVLDISIDPTTNAVTVEGHPNHRLGTPGGGMVRWRCEPGQGHQGWKVKFKDSPFTSGQKEFSGNGNGTNGDRLVALDEEQHFKYDVSCTDSSGETHESDPEIVVWPD